VHKPVKDEFKKSLERASLKGGKRNFESDQARIITPIAEKRIKVCEKKNDFEEESLN